MKQQIAIYLRVSLEDVDKRTNKLIQFIFAFLYRIQKLFFHGIRFLCFLLYFNYTIQKSFVNSIIFLKQKNIAR